MALTLTKITGKVHLPNGEAPVNGRLEFRRATWDANGENIFIRGPASASIANDGSIDVNLQTTFGNKGGALYDVSLFYDSIEPQSADEIALGVRPIRRRQYEPMGKIAVPENGPVDITQLLSVPIHDHTLPDVLVQILAAAGRVEGAVEIVDAAVFETAEQAAIAAAASLSAQESMEGAQDALIEATALAANMFTVVVESSLGTVFRPGEDMTTTLRARVFRGGVEVTDSLDVNRFKWRRVSAYPMPPPDDDETWNAQFSGGYRTISINPRARATYFCRITE